VAPSVSAVVLDRQIALGFHVVFLRTRDSKIRKNLDFLTGPPPSQTRARNLREVRPVSGLILDFLDFADFNAVQRVTVR
jgi:hypothetical protein